MVNKDAFVSRLKPIVEALDCEFKELSYIHAGALFREHCFEFASALYALIIEPTADHRVSCELSRRMCELSREVLFAADDASLSEGCIKNISSIFKLSAQTISAVLPTMESSGVRDEMQGYIENIDKRAIDNPWKSLNESEQRAAGLA